MKSIYHSDRMFYGALVVLISIVQPCLSLNCYECTDQFKDIWTPRDCEVNASAVPLRQCNSVQEFCYVERVTVKDTLIKITRDCIDECFYGCKATGFGITYVTCTSCCKADSCNTGSYGVPYKLRPLNPWCMAVCLAMAASMRYILVYL